MRRVISGEQGVRTRRRAAVLPRPPKTVAAASRRLKPERFTGVAASAAGADLRYVRSPCAIAEPLR